ncbi:MAG TPA: hypothetical protein VMZ28_01980, partial [Kofleriaceae bacterium]|nr:hypothetical protein [Kofleriaceae bacterium]
MLHARSILAASLSLAACAYDPPPEVTLDIPAEGAFRSGDPLTLHFSEPIDPDTLAIRVWASERDAEGELPAGAAPLQDTCRLADAPCGEADLTLSEDATSAEVVLARDTLGAPGLPLILEITDDLTDTGGASRGIPEWFDVQFSPRRQPNTEPVSFDDGVYVIVAEIDDPVPAIITLVTDIRVIPDGSLALAAAEGDPIGEAPKNTSDPAQLKIDDTENGFGLHAWGFVQQQGGERYIDTDPIDVNLSLGLTLVIHDVRINGVIAHDEELDADRIDGTLTFSGLTLNPGENEASYPAGNTSFTADRAPDSLVPEGTPRVPSSSTNIASTTSNIPTPSPGSRSWTASRWAAGSALPARAATASRP